MTTWDLLGFKSFDGLTFVKVKTGWDESTISSAHYYTSGKHKFTVDKLISPDRLMVIGIFWEKFNYRGTHIGYDDYSRSYHG
jgi:hypothetical protein